MWMWQTELGGQAYTMQHSTAMLGYVLEFKIIFMPMELSFLI